MARGDSLLKPHLPIMLTIICMEDVIVLIFFMVFVNDEYDERIVMKYFTKQWYRNNQKPFCFKKVHMQSEKVMDDYWEHYSRIELHLPESIKKIHTNQGMDMHDCKIIDSGFVGKDFYMNIDSNGGFCSVNKLIFTNAEVLKSDINLDNAWWLYDEVYIQENRYEMHMLFHSKTGELGEMIILFAGINYVELN